MFNSILKTIKSFKMVLIHSKLINIFLKNNWLLSYKKLNSVIVIYITYLDLLVSRFKVTVNFYNHIYFLIFCYLYISVILLFEIYYCIYINL